MLETDPKEDVLQLYTSGTTGHPKGVVLSHGAYLSLFEQGLLDGFVTWEPGDPNLVAMPYFHVAGTNWALLGFYQAATNIIVKEVDPVAVLDLIEQYKVQTSFFVPAVILFLVQASAAKPRDFFLAAPGRLRRLAHCRGITAEGGEDLRMRLLAILRSDGDQWRGGTPAAGRS